MAREAHRTALGAAVQREMHSGVARGLDKPGTSQDCISCAAADKAVTSHAHVPDKAVTSHSTHAIQDSAVTSQPQTPILFLYGPLTWTAGRRRKRGLWIRGRGLGGWSEECRFRCR
eukprot:227832-Rhodomonas_salina.1